MFDIDSLAVDPKKSVEGTWVKFLGLENTQLKIARHNNRKAENARSARLYQFYQELKDDKDPAVIEQKFRQVQAEVMAEFILLDWKGISKGGKELPYSVDNAIALLSDPKYEDLYQWVFNESTKKEHYELANETAVVEDVKDSADS